MVDFDYFWINLIIENNSLKPLNLEKALKTPIRVSTIGKPAIHPTTISKDLGFLNFPFQGPVYFQFSRQNDISGGNMHLKEGPCLLHMTEFTVKPQFTRNLAKVQGRKELPPLPTNSHFHFSDKVENR